MSKSRTTLILEGLSSATRSHDIKKEMERYGSVVEVERDTKERIALVKFKRSDDAEYAWRKSEGTRMDGRTWKVDYARKSDFEFMDWPWEEGSPSPRRPLSNSPSRSPSRSPSPAKREVPLAA